MADCGADEVRIALEATSTSMRSRAVVGRVVAAGDAATDWLQRRVVVPTLTSCGECDFCRRGAPQGCAVAVRLARRLEFEDSIECKARYLAPCDGQLHVQGPCAAVLGGDGLLAYAAFCALGVAPGEPLVAVGAGTRSDLARQIAAAKSAAVLDLESAQASAGDKPWRAMALDATAAELAELLSALPAGSDVAIAADAPTESAQEALLKLAPASLAARGIRLIFVGEGHPDLLPELIALAVRRELDLASSVEIIARADASGAAIDAVVLRRRAAIVEA